MPIQVNKIEVNGTAYSVTDFTGTQSREASKLLLSIIGPSISSLFDGQFDQVASEASASKDIMHNRDGAKHTASSPASLIEKAKKDPYSLLDKNVNIGGAVASLVTNTTDSRINELIDLLVSKTIAHEQREQGVVDLDLSNKEHFDSHFGGPQGFKQMVSVVAKIAGLAFGSFFDTSTT